MAANLDGGIASKPSTHSVDDTVAKLKSLLDAKGVMIFTIVDHSGEAAKVGLKMRPTKLVIFGNPKAGTPLMQAGQTIGIDLPLKALVWQDAAGKTQVSYNEPGWLARRHGLGPETDGTVAAMTGMLAKLAKLAGKAH